MVYNIYYNKGNNMSLKEELQRANPFDFYEIVEEDLKKDVLQYIYNKVMKRAENITYQAKALLIAAMHYHQAKIETSTEGAIATVESRLKSIREFLHLDILENKGSEENEYVYFNFLDKNKEFVKRNIYLHNGIDVFVSYAENPIEAKKMLIDVANHMIDGVPYCQSNEVESYLVKNLTMGKTIALKELTPMIPDIYKEVKEFIVCALIIHWSLVEIGEEEYTLQSKLKIINECLLGININGRKNPVIEKLENHKFMYVDGKPLNNAINYLSLYSNNFESPFYGMREYIDFVIKYISASIKDKIKNEPKEKVSSVKKVVDSLETEKSTADFNTAESRHKDEVEKLKNESDEVNCIKCKKLTNRYFSECSHCGATEFINGKFLTQLNKDDSFSKLERDVNDLDVDTVHYSDEVKNKKIIGGIVLVMLVIFLFL